MTFAGFACLRLCGAFLEVVVVLRLLNLGLIVKRRLVGTKSCYFCWVDYLLAGLLRISLSERRISFVECLGGALGVYFDDADVFSWSRSFYKVVGEVVDLARWIHLSVAGFVYLTQGWYLFFVFIGLGNTSHPNWFGIYTPSSLTFFVSLFWAGGILPFFVRTTLGEPASSRSRT